MMVERILHFTQDGEAALGFDTGLSAAAFAQAKLAQFISQTGYIVEPPGGDQAGPPITVWRPRGVVEREDPAGAAVMVVWGPDFPGEPLDRVIGDDAAKDRALDALRYWLRARRLLLDREDAAPPFPGGALIAPSGALLFPPEWLIRRVLEARGPGGWIAGADAWLHPDLSGEGALAFSAAALAYRVFCGSPPFHRDDAETLHEDIREGVFLPASLAAEGLRRDLAAALDRSLGLNEGKKAPPPPGPAALETLLGPPGTAPFSRFFSAPAGEERQKWRMEREKFQKRRDQSVKQRRFIRRNRIALTASLAALVVAGLIAYSVVRGRADMPTTRGMSPQEVLDTYYGAFNTMDHLLMEACVLNKAGKEDINLVTNIFVITRVRGAYEMGAASLSPQEWMDRGSPPTDLTVFGVSGLQTLCLDPDAEDGQVSYRVDYELWLPDLYPQVNPEPPPDPEGLSPPPPALFLPQGHPIRDEVDLQLHKGAWRIAGIRREGSPDY
jgi:hypothetical protein